MAAATFDRNEPSVARPKFARSTPAASKVPSALVLKGVRRRLMRRLLSSVAGAASLFLGFHSATFAAPTPEQVRPPYNVVFVLVDDLRFDMMGFLTPGLRTPNIDRLAREGLYFKNAVVTSSLCSPSRATILTGQTIRNHGIIDNNDTSEAGLKFFPSYLKEANYTTAFIGKWHMGMSSDDPRPGFDKWVSFKGQGTYFPTDERSPEKIGPPARQTLNVDGSSVPRKGYVTDELTDYALDWLQRGRDKSKPFFLYLSHKAVHSHAVAPLRYEHQYDDLEIKLPASMANTPENNRGKPVWVRNARNSWHGSDFAFASDRPLKEVVRDIYRTLTPVDDSLGRIMAYLKKAGLDRNTMIVFYSDNGYLTGDHGLTDKRNAYEGSVRVPMLVWAPGLVPHGVSEAVVRNLDLAPSFLDLAGIPKPAQMEGASWLPLAEGGMADATWKPGDFIYEYYWEWTFPINPTTFAIERDRIKYIQYHGVWDMEELYDLRSDPGETNNLIGDPLYYNKKVELRAALYRQLADSRGRHAIAYGERNGTGIIQRDANGTRAADFPESWYVFPNLPDRAQGMFPETLKNPPAAD